MGLLSELQCYISTILQFEKEKRTSDSQRGTEKIYTMKRNGKGKGFAATESKLKMTHV